MAKSQKELAVTFFNDVLDLEIVGNSLDELDEKECLTYARKKIKEYLGKKILKEFEEYILNGN